MRVTQALQGKKVLVGGIEGLSRFLQSSRDKNAWQLFGNGAGVSRRRDVTELLFYAARRG